jgi:hypothetical protein
MSFYNKYIKYKQKYYALKQTGSALINISDLKKEYLTATPQRKKEIFNLMLINNRSKNNIENVGQLVGQITDYETGLEKKIKDNLISWKESVRPIKVPQTVDEPFEELTEHILAINYEGELYQGRINTMEDTLRLEIGRGPITMYPYFRYIDLYNENGDIIYKNLKILNENISIVEKPSYKLNEILKEQNNYQNNYYCSNCGNFLTRRSIKNKICRYCNTPIPEEYYINKRTYETRERNHYVNSIRE